MRAILSTKFDLGYTFVQTNSMNPEDYNNEEDYKLVHTMRNNGFKNLTNEFNDT